jgi:hypothetical protein
MDFEAHVHRVAQRLIPPHGNGGYPPIVVYYYRHPPRDTAEQVAGADRIPRRQSWYPWLRQYGSVSDLSNVVMLKPAMVLGVRL